MAKKLATRLEMLEKKAAPEGRSIMFAIQDQDNPELFTIDGDPKKYTEAELDKLAGVDNRTLWFIIRTTEAATNEPKE